MSELGISKPILALPWTVMHKIDKSSPLYGLNQQDLIEVEGEIIIMFEGADELTSVAFQRRWSYIASDILWGYRFIECVDRNDKGILHINYFKFSEVILCE